MGSNHYKDNKSSVNYIELTGHNNAYSGPVVTSRRVFKVAWLYN